MSSRNLDRFHQFNVNDMILKKCWNDLFFNWVILVYISLTFVLIRNLWVNFEIRWIKFNKWDFRNLNHILHYGIRSNYHFLFFSFLFPLKMISLYNFLMLWSNSFLNPSIFESLIIFFPKMHFFSRICVMMIWNWFALVRTRLCYESSQDLDSKTIKL